MDDRTRRLEASRTGFERLRPAIAAGEPWPLSPAYGAEPESDWGPKEVLAHVAEMAPYWIAQFDSVLAAPSSAVPPFGRVATDPDRIGRIGRDRSLPADELLDRIDASIGGIVAWLDDLTPAAATRRGAHPRLGEITVGDMVDRFVIGHLEDHVHQLEEVLARRAEVESGRAG